MITLEQALEQAFSLVSPLGTEQVDLANAHGRVLAIDAVAGRDQPPFPAAAMDGYAVCGQANRYKIIGESAAGAGFAGAVRAGEAVRIFTGAPVPNGANRVIPQEMCERVDDSLTVSNNPEHPPDYIRPQGADFAQGFVLSAPVRLDSPQIALLAAMNCARVSVRRKPVIALVSMGNELVALGDKPNANQIIASNALAIRALLDKHGAVGKITPIAADSPAELDGTLAQCGDADLIVTLGGASVGDYDIIGQMVRAGALETLFYQVAMRPGKPMLAGRYQGRPMIGLPGNPVSALVCAMVVLVPVVRAMLGFAGEPMPERLVKSGGAIAANNGGRAHYMRAVLRMDAGAERVFVFERQDSSLLAVMERANCLVVRPAGADAVSKGEPVQIIDF